MKNYIKSVLGASLLSCALITIASTPIIEITSEKELTALIASGKPLVINFSKDECPYCDYLNPIFKQAAEQCKEEIIFAAVKIRSNQQWYKDTFKFNTVPTVVYFKNGKQLHRHGSENKKVNKQYIFDIIAHTLIKA